MIKIIYKGKNLPTMKKEASRAFVHVKSFFRIMIPPITIYIYQNRKEFDDYFGEKTAPWFVGNAVGQNKIHILCPEAMKKESSHKQKEFLPILKHELTHLFISHLAEGRAVPKWLNEGLAAYVAKQHRDKKESLYIENNFCRKLSTPQGWNKNVNNGAYHLAALYVAFLIKKYSFNNIIKLLTSLQKNYYHSDFKKIFFTVYGCRLEGTEKMFITEINKLK